MLFVPAEKRDLSSAHGPTAGLFAHTPALEERMFAGEEAAEQCPLSDVALMGACVFQINLAQMTPASHWMTGRPAVIKSSQAGQVKSSRTQ